MCFERGGNWVFCIKYNSHCEIPSVGLGGSRMILFVILLYNGGSLFPNLFDKSFPWILMCSWIVASGIEDAFLSHTEAQRAEPI